VSSTRISRHMNAPRDVVYRALLDPGAIAKWRVPDGMTSHVHEFEPREGGSIRISLTYDQPTATGKTTAHTDTYHGRFVNLVTNEQVVEVDEFETTDPALRGEMTITITLADADGGTDLLAVHDGLPPGVPAADNEAGWRMSLGKLAALVEAGGRHTNVTHPPRDNDAYRFPVSVKGVVIRDGDVVLLENERGEWELPGGKLELSESPELCVAREFEEELQLAIRPDSLLDSWVYTIVPGIHVLILTYGCSETSEREAVLSHEHKQLGWVPLAEVDSLRMPEGYKASIRCWAARVQVAG
jgi:uncharacterized protein YndB with AHSA1/START domain/8-oxo-dGTP pyrophosphatase MutT (NUDIX family)